MSRARAASPGEVRCHCGNLLARWVGDRLELKCRRCKHCVLLDVEPRETSQVPSASSSEPGERAGDPGSGRR
ncbi:MAG TPA: hypothetical protein VHG72_01825 [Polyangia bacterium]|nr:hypothetical protein [Polyangia bacterium]